LLRELAPPNCEVVEDVRYVDNGKIVTAGGITAGFGAALHAVATLHGKELAVQTAAALEYIWNEER